MKPLVLSCALGVAACILPAVAVAQSAQAAPVPAVTPAATPSEIGRVTTSDRRDEPLSNVSKPTYVIDRATIERFGMRTVGDALRIVPGANIYRYGGFGASSNYGLLGSTSAQTLVLIDGVPVANGSTGTIDLSTLSSAGVRRIEVVESAASTLYGSGAIGGVINIITGALPSGGSVSTGSLGESDLRANAAANGLSVAVERHIATNNYAYPPSEKLKGGTRTNAYGRQSAIVTGFERDLGATLHLSAHLRSDAVTSGIPGSVKYPSPNAIQANARTGGDLTLSRRGARSEIALTVSGSAQKLLYNDPDSGPENDTYDARTQIALRDVVGDERRSLTTGIDLSRQTAALWFGTSADTPPASAAIAQSAAYAQYAAQFSNATRMTFGVRGEHDAPQGSALLPSIGLLTHANALTLAGNYGTAFRVPTIDDLYYPGYSNPNLRPERSKNADLTASAPAGNVRLSAGWFARDATDLIVLDAKYVPQNVSRAQIRGLRFDARTTSPQGVVSSLGIVDLYRAADVTPNAPQKRLRYTPVMSVVAGLERPLAETRRFGWGTNVRFEGNHVESTAWRGAFATIDGYVRARLAPSDVVTLRVRNIGNDQTMPISGYPAPGRTFEIEFATR